MPQALRARLIAVAGDLRRLARGRPDSLSILERVLNQVPLPVLVANDDGKYLIANNAAVSLTGYDVEALQSLSVWDLTPSLNAAEALSRWHEFLESAEQQGEYTLLVSGNRVVRVAYAAMANILPGFHISVLRLHEH